MPDYTLTVLDTTGIQNYIFGSNRVPENVGASQLVVQATHGWMRESLPEGRHNLDADGEIISDRRLEKDDALDAEVILRGGGNVLILFRSLDLAKSTVAKLTRKLLTDAPGLELAVAHHTFDWEKQEIGGEGGAHRALYAALNRSKQQRRNSAPLLGLGVTLECRATGMPALVFVEDDNRQIPVSAEVAAKLNKGLQDAARQRIESIFPEVTQAGYIFRRDFGLLGGTEGEVNYIAVVHADGNAMGKLFENVISDFPTAAQNRVCLNALRQLSQAVDHAGQQALREAVRRMTEGFKTNNSEEMQAFLHGIQKDGKTIIPFRPIVYGGDDVTFVCDGRLGLALAAIYLEEWERATAADATIGKAYACAGVAIVKAHYPFVRAYKLAADLCDRAKQEVRGARCANPELGDASALDWHFAMSGISGTIKEIRKREYTIQHENDLTLRPLMLREPILVPAWRTWATFDRVTRELQGEKWRGRRNKIKELHEVLRKGEADVKQFRHAFNLCELPQIDASRPDLQQTGWASHQCGYFDMIEALDFYIPLAEVR